MMNWQKQFAQSPEGKLWVDQGQVMNPVTNVPDSTISNITLGKSNEVLMSELHGKYYNLALRGIVFHGSTAKAGVAVPASASTSPVFGLWNPAGSGVNLELIAEYYGFVGTPQVATNLGYDFKTGVGAAIGTAAPISAFTPATPNNALLGAGAASKALFAPAGTITLAAAGTYLGTNSMSNTATTAAGTAAGNWQQLSFLDGTIIIPPGTILYPTAGNAAISGAIAIRWVWAEFPILSA